MKKIFRWSGLLGGSLLWVLMLGLGTVTTGCNDQIEATNRKLYHDSISVIQNYYNESERTCVLQSSVNDSLAKSVVNFSQAATFCYKNSAEDVDLLFNLTPEIYLNVTLSKTEISYQANGALVPTLVRSRMVSNKPWKSGNTYGVDVVKEFEFSDGNVATARYGWNYLGVVANGDTLATPHGEIIAFDLVDIKSQRLSSTNYQIIPNFAAKVMTKGVSGSQIESTTRLKPWYNKVADEGLKVYNAAYHGSYSGCPNLVYNLTETLETNQGTKVNKYQFPIAFVVTAPNVRDQNAADSLFNAVSSGSKVGERTVSETKNGDGFTVRQISGSYVSTNTGRTNGTTVRDTLTYTVKYPVKFESAYGSYQITPMSVSFEELGFAVTKVSQSNGVAVFKTVNSVMPKLNTCQQDVVDEVLRLRVTATVVGEPTYDAKLSWNGNEAVMTVTKTAADGKKTPYTRRKTLTMGTLADGRVTAENTDFSASETHSERSNTVKNTPWTDVIRTRTFVYTVSNGTVERQMTHEVTDYQVTFNDGTFYYVFDLSLKMSNQERFGSATRDGDYDITPHILTVTGMTSDGKTLTAKGTTNIYVKRKTNVTVTGHSEKTVVYSDGTVDAVVILKKSDGTSETYKASDAFGARFAFKFTNVSAQEKVVSNVDYQASGSIGGANATETHKQGRWTVVERKYPFNHLLSNGVNADKINSVYGFSNYRFQFNDTRTGDINIPEPTVNMTHKSLNITSTGNSGGYNVNAAKVTVNGYAQGTEGNYSKDLAVTHTLKIKQNDEPPTPHYGKPKSFTVTATFDPTANVTRRAFCFVWEDGVTYAVCKYEKMLPVASDFKHKADTYKSYNSVAYDKNNSSEHWQPARGERKGSAIYWYDKNNKLISAIDDATCMILGWKNIVNGHYALEIPGYTYTINGYNITVTAPDGQTVTFNSHY